MSFVITMYVREGIVMASDSRLTLTTTTPAAQENQTVVQQLAVGQSDSAYKTFLAQGTIGISTFGDASVQRVPITGYIESFISEQMSQEMLEVDEVPQKLLDYFKALPGTPNTQFHVAGYKTEDDERKQHVWLVRVSNNTSVRLNPPGQQGASWGGEPDIFSRLTQPVATLDEQGNLKDKIAYHAVPYNFFTLQDAIDYAIYAVRATIDSIRFQLRPKTVGGPIDVLVIKPDEAFWVQRKELHGSF